MPRLREALGKQNPSRPAAKVTGLGNALWRILLAIRPLVVSCVPAPCNPSPGAVRCHFSLEPVAFCCFASPLPLAPPLVLSCLPSFGVSSPSAMSSGARSGPSGPSSPPLIGPPPPPGAAALAGHKRARAWYTGGMLAMLDTQTGRVRPLNFQRNAAGNEVSVFCRPQACQGWVHPRRASLLYPAPHASGDCHQRHAVGDACEATSCATCEPRHCLHCHTMFLS